MVARPTLKKIWTDYSAYFMLALFVIIFTTLMVIKHNAFNTRVYDFARFSQAIWNTQNGHFLFTSISNGSILGNHFSPIMALVAPLLLVFPDERILFLVQVLNVAIAAFFLYLIFKQKRPELAPLFLLIILLNPALHEATLFEFRRIIFALPFLALALYALSIHNRKLMLFGLIFALLAKENVGFFVFMIGFYLLVFERDWKWGAALMALGFGWVVVISVWIIPLFNTRSTATDTYPQLYYFDFLGSNYEEILQTLLADPLIIFKRIFQPTQVTAVFRILLPLGLLLPFLKPSWILFCLPYLTILLLSNDEDMIRIEKWYPATLMVVLFAALAVGWTRLPPKWERWAFTWLFLMTFVGYFLYSPAPGGGKFDPLLYEVTARDKLGQELLKSIPPEANVAAQGMYVPHLTHRNELYLYPWITIGPENIDYFLLDLQSDPYPMDFGLVNEHITNFVSDPANIVIQEADGIFLIENGKNKGEQWPAYPIEQTVENSIHLDRIEVALTDDRGIFRPQTDDPLTIKPGQTVRVTLYWEALAAPKAERTVSVRIVDPTGYLLAQHDGIPAASSKPTSWWQKGWQIRDVHYLTVPPDSPQGGASLDLVLYDTYTLERILFAGNKDSLQLLPLSIQ